MNIVGIQSLVALLLNAAFLPTNAATSCVHESLRELGFVEFSRKLESMSMDLQYGEFTIFAPSDELLRNGVLILENEGHSNKTINDILLFHVSAERTNENVTDATNCGESLLMLNEELHVNQESSVTDCESGKVYQIGPGNIAPKTMPEVTGDPVSTCHAVIYSLQGSLMLPTLPNVTLPPTTAPAPTEAPNRQSNPTPTVTANVTSNETPNETSNATNATTGTEDEDSSGSIFLSSKKSFAFAAAVGLVTTLL